ncbi:MAG: hypothetical protein OXB88_03015, partial [Bacteriovoracales bacterium]|nr:hypothetical protein [Bacteriovoracales bacterium]
MKLQDPSEIEVPEDIKIAAVWGRLTFFIGNGLSRLDGVPSWDELPDEMLKALLDNEKIKYSEYHALLEYPTKIKISIADSYFKKYPEMTYKKILMEKVPELKTRSDAYRNLSKI